MQVLFQVWTVNLGRNGVSVPSIKRQLTSVEHQLAWLFDVFVADDWLHSGVGVVDQQLVDSLGWNFIAVVFIVRV